MGGGYLGVDIFFVISGYLITKMIVEKRAKGTFSFLDFYTRRARRLLPAAYVTFAATALAAPYFLGADALRDLYEQLLGAIAFCANMVLLNQSGYFGIESELKPLLHIWSLSVEEQYYFLLPAFFALVNRKYWLATILAGAAASFAVYTWKNEATYSFYILPTRAWEMGFGSIVALTYSNERLTAFVRRLRWGYWPLLLAVPVVAVDILSPAMAALAACALTALIIMAGPSPATSAPALRPVRWVGDISYSLYLAHWPGIAFFNNSWFGVPGQPKPLEYQVGLLLLAFALAVPLHYLVEKPVHLANNLRGRRLVFGAVGGATLIALGAVLGIKPSADDPRLATFAPNFGISRECEYGPQFTDAANCRTTPAPELLVWGDSYAMQWVPGLLAARPGIGLIQATRSACAPILDLAVMNAGDTDPAWSLDCISFNRSVFEAIERSPSVRTVVLAGNLDRHASRKFNGVVSANEGKGSEVVSLTPELTLEALERTVRALQSKGKRVVFLGPLPSSGLDVARCEDRRKWGLVSIGAPADCLLPRSEALETRGPVYALLDSLAAHTGATVINPFAFLCASEQCITAMDDVALYHDPGHLSNEGSRVLSRRMRLDQLIDSLPR